MSRHTRKNTRKREFSKKSRHDRAHRIRGKVSSSSNRVKIEGYRDPCIAADRLWRGWWRENMATTRAKFRNARDTISWWGRARKFPQTIANLPLNTERTDHDSRGHSIQFDWRRINGCRGGDGVLFPTVPSSSTNRNVVLRKWRSLDRSLKFYRKKERKEKRIEEEKRSGGCGWINLREKNFGKRF